MIYSRFYNTKSAADSGTLFSDRILINLRNVTSDPHYSYRPNRDFLSVVFRSKVIIGAMTLFGFSSKSENPSKFKFTQPLETMSKSQKLDLPHTLASGIVDKYVLQSQNSVEAFVKSVLTEKEQAEVVNDQELTEDGRFLCRYPGCTKSYKYDGQHRRNHELAHDPPVIIEKAPVNYECEYPDTVEMDVNNVPFGSNEHEKKEESKEEVKSDDVYNYNCALLTDCFLFFIFSTLLRRGIDFVSCANTST